MTALLSLLVAFMWQTSDMGLLIAMSDQGDTYQFSDDYDGDGLE
jgi:hypothetical protein